MQHPPLNRVPGKASNVREKYLEDLSKLNQTELLDLKARQVKLLSNKNQLVKLPDKGKKIQDLYDKICKELDTRNQINRAAELFSELNIATIGKKRMDKLEWDGKCATGQKNEMYLDSDDDETDPLKILAHSTKNQANKLVKIETEKPLITESDIKEIESFKEEPIKIENVELKDTSKFNKIFKSHQKEAAAKVDTVDSDNSSLEVLDNSSRSSIELLEPHAMYLCEKDETTGAVVKKQKFLPFKTTKSNVHDPEKERIRKLGKHWEVTAATPPPIQHNGVKMLSLQESIEVENIQREKMKIAIAKQAEDRLAMKLSRETNREPTLKLPDDSHKNLHFKNYRDILEEDPSDNENDLNSNGSENEEGDE